MIKINKKILISVLIIAISIILIVFCVINKNNGNEILNDFSEENIEILGENKTGNEEQNKKQDDDFIYVHIAGEVINNGIVKLHEGDRIIDAVSLAGGFTEKADLNKINLAFILNDGCKIRIPSIDEKDDNLVIISQGDEFNIVQEGVNAGNGGKVNINSATQSQLETITGIGPSTAMKIIEYRKQNGKFSKIEDIKNVSGIGEEKFNNIKNQISVK